MERTRKSAGKMFTSDQIISQVESCLKSISEGNFDIPNIQCENEELNNICQYINNTKKQLAYSLESSNELVNNVSKGKVDETDNPSDLVFFLKLIHLTDVKLPRKKYLSYFKKIKKYSGEDFCSFFNNPALNFQIFDDEEIKEIYCEECSGK